MGEAKTREDVLQMARWAGLDLPPKFHGDLMAAHAKLEGMLSRMKRERERGAEPAHVFLPERFMPQG